jgi:hypothetical protein
MRGRMAETSAEAQAQTLKLPQNIDGDWRGFAGLMDGNQIAQEMGLDFHSWGQSQEEKYQNSGCWELPLLELRLMLFYEFRADHMTGWTYHERDSLVDSLLQSLSEKLGQPYTPMEHKNDGKEQS